jgi:hypothetical protein
MRASFTIRAVVAASAALSLVRVIVLFSESWSAVRAERAGDAALLQICEEQTLANSDKFRNACLAARADSAAPIFFKILMRSVHRAFTDFCEAFNTPARLCLLLLFLLSGVSAPIVKALVAILIRGATSTENNWDRDQEDARLIFVGSPMVHAKKSPWANLRQRIRRRSTPKVDEVYSDDEDRFYESEQESMYDSRWSALSMMPYTGGGVHSKHI